MHMQYFVYILASKRNGTLYTGVTNNLIKRVYEHRHNLMASFTQAYNVHLLVYFEVHQHIETAIKREKIIKHWKRDWRIELIEKNNKEWKDLYSSLV